MTKHTLQSVILMGTLGVLLVGCGNDSIARSRSAVRINELSPLNGVYQDIFGNSGDWIELYNIDNKDFDLEGYYISDSVNKRFKDVFAAGYIVPAKGVLLLFADGQPLETRAIEPHLSFKLSNQGDGVWLSNPSGYLVDSVEFSILPPNDAGTRWTSFARFPDGTGEFQWCTAGTPNKRNGDHCTGQTL